MALFLLEFKDDERQEDFLLNRGGESYLKVRDRLIHKWTIPLTNWVRTCNSINYTNYGE